METEIRYMLKFINGEAIEIPLPIKTNMKYITIINNEVTIACDKLPFNISRQKCESYLDLHYPGLIHNTVNSSCRDDVILRRCKNIFKLLLRYINDYEDKRDKDNNKFHILWSRNEFWDDFKDHIISGTWKPREKFDLLFYDKNFKLLLENPNPLTYDEIGELPKYYLPDLLTDGEQYQIFVDYYSKYYDYYDIYNAMKYVMNKYEASEDLIDIIICSAVGSIKNDLEIQY